MRRGGLSPGRCCRWCAKPDRRSTRQKTGCTPQIRDRCRNKLSRRTVEKVTFSKGKAAKNRTDAGAAVERVSVPARIARLPTANRGEQARTEGRRRVKTTKHWRTWHWFPVVCDEAEQLQTPLVVSQGPEPCELHAHAEQGDSKGKRASEHIIRSSTRPTGAGCVHVGTEEVGLARVTVAALSLAHAAIYRQAQQ